MRQKMPDLAIRTTFIVGYRESRERIQRFAEFCEGNEFDILVFSLLSFERARPVNFGGSDLRG
jgi:tRNA A37 methylthiotransferase MiaB